MKQLPPTINALLACTLVFTLLSLGLPNFNAHASTPVPTPQPVQASQPSCNTSRTLQVSGTAVVKVAPDRALIQLGVQSNGRSPGEVQSRNSATISRVISTLKAMGVDSRDIATDWYIIQPIYEDYDSLSIKGYRIHNVIAVTMRDVGKTGDVIAAAFQAGANQVVDVEFYTSELRKYRDQAREMAVKAAREKADLLAGAADAKTDCVLTINENVWSYYNGWFYGRDNSNLWTQNAVQNASPASTNDQGSLTDGGPVSIGQISIRAEVNTTFSLK